MITLFIKEKHTDLLLAKGPGKRNLWNLLQTFALEREKEKIIRMFSKLTTSSVLSWSLFLTNKFSGNKMMSLQHWVSQT